MGDEIIEGEATEVGQELEVRQAPGAVTLFGTDDPGEVVARATIIANSLADVIEQKRLYKVINQKKYVYVEAWTLLGTMLGVFPVVEWTRKLDNGWEARVVVQNKEGQIVGAAEAECLRSESKWKSTDDYAIRSMAQTRAVSKALRHPLGFVMTLAGYAETPADEINERVVAEPPSEPSEPSPTLLRGREALQVEIQRLQGVPGWSAQEIIVASAQSFKRPIQSLDDLRVGELRSIVTEARKVPPLKNEEVLNEPEVGA